MLLRDVDGALWNSGMLETARMRDIPDLDRIVVAVDPATTSTSTADECGIVVAGAVTEGPPEDWCAFVLADRTVKGASPAEWARAAIAAMEEFEADRLVAEVNQGGEMVRQVIRAVDPMVPFTSVHALSLIHI